MINGIKRNIINILGWSTNRKIVVFESDDWGSIRVPSIDHYKKLIQRGIRVDLSLYDKLDSLENKNDLKNLFSVLSKFKDKQNHHPIFTFNVVMGNPDFEKIKKNNFQTYYHEFFFDSYKKYNHEDVMPYWEKGIQERLIRPQFHGREHLNSELWLRDLQKGLKETLIAFENNFFAIKTQTSSRSQAHYLAGYRSETPEELENLKHRTADGLHMFENTFGFKSKSFIACNYVWPTEIEEYVSKLGIDIIQGQRGHIVPNPYDKGKVKIKRHYTGQKNKTNQVYTVRNVKFEPFENASKNWVNSALNEISNAFFWKKPAIISTHRINYVSGKDLKHRDVNLKSLEALIKEILLKWPNVEFMTTDQLGKLIKQ